MKKLLLVGALALFGAMNAQTTGGFKLGAHIGMPVGDASDGLSFIAGVDLGYTWRIAENFDLGVTTGYSEYFGKKQTYNIPGYGTIELDAVNSGMIPVAATGQYNFNGGMFLGLDLGYAIFTAEGADGGFLYQPKVGYTFNSKNDLYLGYRGISVDGGTISSINLGYAYKF